MSRHRGFNGSFLRQKQEQEGMNESEQDRWFLEEPLLPPSSAPPSPPFSGAAAAAANGWEEAAAAAAADALESSHAEIGGQAASRDRPRRHPRRFRGFSPAGEIARARGSNDVDNDEGDDALFDPEAALSRMRCCRFVLCLGSAVSLVLALGVVIWTLVLREAASDGERKEHQFNRTNRTDGIGNRTSDPDDDNGSDDLTGRFLDALALALAASMLASAVATLAGTWAIPSDGFRDARAEDGEDSGGGPGCCQLFCLTASAAMHLAASVLSGLIAAAFAFLVHEHDPSFPRWLPSLFRSRDENNNYLMSWILLGLCASHLLQRILVRSFRRNLDRLSRHLRRRSGLFSSSTSPRPWWWHHQAVSSSGHDAATPSTFWHDDRRWLSWLTSRQRRGRSSPSNPRDDGSVDFASVQEDWLNRSMEDPTWWSRDHNDDGDNVEPQDGERGPPRSLEAGKEGQPTKVSRRIQSKDLSWAEE